MKSIRQFLYLDEYKMYSLFSQLFEGSTDYIVRYAEAAQEESETQKGPVASGRVLADLAATKQSQEERRILNDYAYTLFEDEIDRQGILATIEEGVVSTHVVPGSLVRVRGTAILNDMRAISSFIKNFNAFGEALTYVQSHAAREELEKTAQAALQTVRDRNQKARIKEELRAKTDLQTLAKRSNLRQDEQFLTKLASLLDFGYGDHFEIRCRPVGATSNAFYSALLKRESLRENESLTVKKFGRHAEGQFSLIGVMCQVGDPSTGAEPPKEEFTHFKEAIYNMVTALAGVETSFTGRIDNEYVVDPIAVYRLVEGTSRKDEVELSAG
jgi:hypothetical protein